MASVIIPWPFILTSVQRLEVNYGQRLYCQLNGRQLISSDLKWSEWDRFSRAIKTIQQLPLFKELKLTSSGFATEVALLEFLNKTPNITDLEVSSYPMTDLFLQKISRMCPKLEKINISCCNEITEEGLQALLALPRLQNINVAACPQITGKALVAAKNRPGLLRLDLSLLPELTNETVAKILQANSQLIELQMSRCTKLTPEVFGSVEQLPFLETLALDSWVITDEQLAAIAKKTPLLAFLNLNRSGGYSWKGLDDALAAWGKLRRLQYIDAKLDMKDPAAQLLKKHSRIRQISSLTFYFP